MATTVTYVRKLYPGAMVPEESVQRVQGRNPAEIVAAASKGVYAFQFIDRLEVAAETGGEALTLASKDRNASGWFYVDGVVFTRADVEQRGLGVLLDNMRSNGWDRVVRCRHGNYQPFNRGDSIVSTDA